ncbi:hypothetical protein Q765_00275 [Flavobacterium rivuli WB 3.3-2 = DSM 21788]|uniref:DUF1320 domain-containing protein n=1 Tax=Flavobacterium rivuli WB 3.3-2 = DSM 21788 TaxID=1121895 RepID=A0A0A2M7Y4_9FLAO|nr:phage protein Gp36 family protein [Flavobacterium rivuli]KGO88389.1 hypothetical protein Q765_00275 [Flavobacterium rivuli WB 3.3-2 = DSM 21788]
MFLTPEDFGQVIYRYQVDQITEGDEALVLEALAAGEEEARSYLEQNTNRHDSMDGRLIYDVEAIFNASGEARNPLLKTHCLTLAKWHLVQLCNADIILETATERYDRAIAWLTKVSNGTITVKSLPTLTPTTEQNNSRKPFSYGSRKKFRHE